MLALGWRELDRARWPVGLSLLRACLQRELRPGELALAASRVDAGVRPAERISAYAAVIGRMRRHWPVLAWQQGTLGEVAVAAGAAGYECGIGWRLPREPDLCGHVASVGTPGGYKRKSVRPRVRIPLWHRGAVGVRPVGSRRSQGYRRYTSPGQSDCLCHHHSVSDWGRATFGDPCRECGYAWSHDPQDMIETVRRASDDMRLAFAGSGGTTRSPAHSWDARAYVCHVGDNLRIWAERLVAAVEVPNLAVGAYDADLLATARNYSAIPLRGALWSLERAIDAWLSAVEVAWRSDIVLLHPERGSLYLADVMSTNAHDAHHHVFDVRRSVE